MVKMDENLCMEEVTCNEEKELVEEVVEEHDATQAMLARLIKKVGRARTEVRELHDQCEVVIGKWDKYKHEHHIICMKKQDEGDAYNASLKE